MGKNTTIVVHIRGRWGGKENATINRIRGERQNRTNAAGGGGGGQQKQHNNQPKQMILLFFVVLFVWISLQRNRLN